MRDVLTFTIDPHDAKDFDDALSIQKLGTDKWEIGIHIADVSHYVAQGSPLNEEAYQRATSVYLVDRVVPIVAAAMAASSNDKSSTASTGTAAIAGTNAEVVAFITGYANKNINATVSDAISVSQANSLDASITGVVTATVSPSTLSSLAALTNANANNALSITVTPTGSGSSTLHFKSKAYQQNKYSFSITDCRYCNFIKLLFY